MPTDHFIYGWSLQHWWINNIQQHTMKFFCHSAHWVLCVAHWKAITWSFTAAVVNCFVPSNNYTYTSLIISELHGKNFVLAHPKFICAYFMYTVDIIHIIKCLTHCCELSGIKGDLNWPCHHRTWLVLEKWMRTYRQKWLRSAPSMEMFPSA